MTTKGFTYDGLRDVVEKRLSMSPFITSRVREQDLDLVAHAIGKSLEREDLDLYIGSQEIEQVSGLSPDQTADSISRLCSLNLLNGVGHQTGRVYGLGDVLKCIGNEYLC